MMKKFLIIVTFVLLFAIAVIGYGLFYTELKNTDGLRSALNFKVTEIAGYAQIIETSISDKNKLTKDLEAKDKEYLDLVTSFNSMTYELSLLEVKLNCISDSGYIFDMSNHSTVSDSLKIFVGDQGGKVITAKWDKVWTNTKTAIHKLSTDEFLYVFLVDINDEDFGKDAAIFWIDNMCFINLKTE